MKPLIRSLRALLGLSLVGLFLTVESSLQVSIVWDRLRAWWTPWLFKIGPLSIADFTIIAVTIFTVAGIMLRGAVPRSPYLAICGLAAIYLLIGLAYNLFVFTLWKTYLFDVKVVMYFTVPYLFLYTSSSHHRVISWFGPPRLFVYAAVASMIDFAIVTAFGEIEYTAHFGLPILPFLVAPVVSLVGILFSQTMRYKLLFGVLLAIEVINAVNRGSLGLLFTIVSGVVFITILRVRSSLPAKASLILLALAFVNGLAVLMIDNPLRWEILGTKPEGALTRSIQLENVLLNFDENIPGVVGKGLGSTWFEHVPLSDVYAVGTSVGQTAEEAMAMPVKFIVNWAPPALLHKWGLLGSVLLACLIALFYESWNVRLRLLRSSGHGRVRYLYALLILACILALDSFTWPGNLKPAMTTSMLAFYVENQIRQYQAEVGMNLRANLS